VAYQWQENGVNLTNNSTYSGVTTATLSINATSVLSGRTYRVVVANGSCSRTSDNAVLTVVDPPVITVQPQPKSLCSGGSAVFTVTATGATSYQWQENGVNLANSAIYSGVNTATLSVASSSGLSGKTYRVVVSNAGCSVTSNAALLTVNASPGATVTGFAYDPNIHTVKCNALPANSSYAYTWYVDGSAAGPFNGFYQHPFTPNCQQIYQVKVKVRNNATGCESISACKQFYLECGDNYLIDGVDDNRYNNTISGVGACGSGGGGGGVESVSKNSASREIAIHPNPSAKSVKVEMNIDGQKKVEILNNMGTVVFETQVDSEELILDITNFPRGQYYLRVVTNDGRNVIDRLIIDK
jgi:hypothetical protein